MSESASSLGIDETRQRLLDAAEEVFASNGFSGATTREICNRAGVRNIGAINYYFGSKEKLYAAAVAQAMRCCTEGGSFPVWPEGLAPEEKLRQFLHTVMARLLVLPKPSSLQLMTREMTRAEPSDITTEAVHRNIKPMADVLIAIVRELVPQADRMQHILIGQSIIAQCLYYRQNRVIGLALFGNDSPCSWGAEPLAEHVYRFSLAAVGKAPPVPPRPEEKTR